MKYPSLTIFNNQDLTIRLIRQNTSWCIHLTFKRADHWEYVTTISMHQMREMAQRVMHLAMHMTIIDFDQVELGKVDDHVH